MEVFLDWFVDKLRANCHVIMFDNETSSDSFLISLLRNLFHGGLCNHTW